MKAALVETDGAEGAADWFPVDLTVREPTRLDRLFRPEAQRRSEPFEFGVFALDLVLSIDERKFGIGQRLRHRRDLEL